MTKRLFSCDLSQTATSGLRFWLRDEVPRTELEKLLRFVCSHLAIVAASKLLEGTSQPPGLCTLRASVLLALPYVPSSYRQSMVEAFKTKLPN